MTRNDRSHTQYVRLKQEPRGLGVQVFGDRITGYSPFETLTRAETRVRTTESALMRNAQLVRLKQSRPGLAERVFPARITGYSPFMNILGEESERRITRAPQVSRRPAAPAHGPFFLY